MALDGQNAAMQTENYIVMPDLLATTQQLWKAWTHCLRLQKEPLSHWFQKMDVFHRV